MTECQT